jgi:hypothetical protein
LNDLHLRNEKNNPPGKMVIRLNTIFCIIITLIARKIPGSIKAGTEARPLRETRRAAFISLFIYETILTKIILSKPEIQNKFRKNFMLQFGNGGLRVTRHALVKGAN